MTEEILSRKRIVTLSRRHDQDGGDVSDPVILDNSKEIYSRDFQIYYSLHVQPQTKSKQSDAKRGWYAVNCASGRRRSQYSGAVSAGAANWLQLQTQTRTVQTLRVGCS
jgi:hypothetical protein